MADIDLDAMAKRAEAATPGPWSVADVEGDPFVRVDGYLLHQVDFRLIAGGHEQGFSDAEFIAHAREDVPALVAEVRRLTAALADTRTEADLLRADRDEVRREGHGLRADVKRTERERDNLARWKAEARPVMSAFLDLARRVVPDSAFGRLLPDALAEHIDRQAAALAEAEAVLIDAASDRDAYLAALREVEALAREYEARYNADSYDDTSPGLVAERLLAILARHSGGKAE